MATVTITRLSPTRPSQGSYDYLYQANIGLQNLHSVWAHAPRRDSKENCRTLKHGKPSTAASLYDTSSPYAAELFALRLEYRLACALGKRSIQLRDRSVNHSTAPDAAAPNFPKAGKAEPHVERPALEDWSSDYAFDDAVNPFVVAQAETKDAVNRCRLVVDNNDSRPSPPKMLSPPVLSPSPLENTPATRCDPLPEQKATTPLQVHAPKAHRATRPRRPDPSDGRWQAPGPSPLSRSVSAAALTEQGELSSDEEDDDDECFARAFRRHTRRLRGPTIRLLPRGLNLNSGGSGRKGAMARVPVPLRRELHRSRFLDRVCALDIEAPELDSVDERSMEWLLDTQAELLRGRRAVPALGHLGGGGRGPFGDAPRLGTPHRRLKWVQGSGFPRRVKDYGSAAEDMLARRRAREGQLGMDT